MNNNNNRKVVLYIAMSIDGYIAGPGDDLKWLDIVGREGEDYGYADFTNGVDTVIMGRRTYDKVLSFGGIFPHKGRRVYVLSQRQTGSDENVSFYNGELHTLINNLKADGSKANIFVDGGAVVVNELMKQGLIDTYVISVIPYFLGGGVRLFNDGRPERNMHLTRSITYPSGLVQLWYEHNDVPRANNLLPA